MQRLAMKWFRFYSDALENPKVQRLPSDLFKTWVNLLCLANKQDERGRLPSVEDMAFALRLPVEVVVNHLADLTERGLIEAGDDGHRPHQWGQWQRKSDDVTSRVNEYRARERAADSAESGATTEQSARTATVTTPQVTTSNGRSKDETLQVTGSQQKSQRGHNVLDTDTDTESEAERESDAETSPKAKPTPTSVSAADRAPVKLASRRHGLAPPDRERFDTFWRAYPRRVKKAEAVKWWSTHRPDAGQLAAMLDAIARQQLSADWQKENGRFIPHPPTWLNQQRWEDETAPPLPDVPLWKRVKVWD
ncbi:MAG: hypothetical protein ACTHMU_04880 [Thermomicrobiales bacterium]